MSVRDATKIVYGRLPFTEAISFLGGKKLVPTDHWDDLKKEQHDTGFMVAGATKMELLGDFHQAVQQVQFEGLPYKEFQKRFDKIVEKHGWTFKGDRAWRARVIIETNLTTAHQAGRYRQMTHPDVMRLRPYWRYMHTPVNHPRVQHLRWHGLILPADDPWFHTHYPPNGWGCKCYVQTLSRRDFDRLGGKVSPRPPEAMVSHIDRDGEEILVPAGIDPGWDYTPGASMVDRTAKVLSKRARTLPPKLRKAFLEEFSLEVSGKAADVEGYRDELTQARMYSGLGQKLASAFDEAALKAGKVGSPEHAQAWRAAMRERLSTLRGAGKGVFQGDGDEAALAEFRDGIRWFPQAWIERSNKVGTVFVERGESRAFHAHMTRQQGVIETANGKREMREGDSLIRFRTDRPYSIIHEFSHRMQSIYPKIDAPFQEMHQKRTVSDALVRLADLKPDAGYGYDEVTRKDNYIDPYFGKVYKREGVDQELALEVLPMTLQDILGDGDYTLARILRQDRPLVDLAIGVLFGA